MPAFDPEFEYDPGLLEVTVTFTNSHSSTGKEFADVVEAALAACSSDLSGGMTLLPNHDDTGIVLGPS